MVFDYTTIHSKEVNKAKQKRLGFLGFSVILGLPKLN